MSLGSRTNQYRRHQNPTLVVGLCQQGRPWLEPRPRELLLGHRGNQLPREVDRDLPQTRGVRRRPPAKVEGPPPSVGRGSCRRPAKVLPQPPWEVPPTSPPEVPEQGMAPIGTRLPFERPGARSQNPRGLPFQSPQPRSGESRLAKYIAVWSESSHPTPTSSRGAYVPTTLESIYRLLIHGPARPSV